MLRTLALLFFVLIIIHVYLILDLRIIPSESAIIKTIDHPRSGHSKLENDVDGANEEVYKYIDSLQNIFSSAQTILFYDLPYSHNLAISQIKYPKMKETYRFFSVWKDNGEASFIKLNEEFIKLSGQDDNDMNSSKDELVLFGLDKRHFYYSTDRFDIRIELKKMSFWDKTRWFFASAYGIGNSIVPEHDHNKRPL